MAPCLSLHVYMVVGGLLSVPLKVLVCIYLHRSEVVFPHCKRLVFVGSVLKTILTGRVGGILTKEGLTALFDFLCGSGQGDSVSTTLLDVMSLLQF